MTQGGAPCCWPHTITDAKVYQPLLRMLEARHDGREGFTRLRLTSTSSPPPPRLSPSIGTGPKARILGYPFPHITYQAFTSPPGVPTSDYPAVSEFLSTVPVPCPLWLGRPRTRRSHHHPRPQLVGDNKGKQLEDQSPWVANIAPTGTTTTTPATAFTTATSTTTTTTTTTPTTTKCHSN